MLRHKKFHSLSLLFSLALLTFMAACGNVVNTNRSADEPTPITTPQVTQTRVGTSKTTPTPSANTTCPAQGTGRAAITPPLHLGTRQQIVYYHNIDHQMILDIFDVQRQAVSPIIGQNEHIMGAQVSADGQWVLMVVNNNTTSAFQLVRIDGQFFQTLYCAPAGQSIGTSAQWSLDQKQIIFSQGSSNTLSSLNILHLADGSLQQETSPSAHLALTPVTWLDNTRVYVKPTNTNSLYLLDTSKGPNQQISAMKLIRGIGDAFWDFDTSVDGNTLAMAVSLGRQGSSPGQTEIDTDSTSGKLSKQIFLSRTMFIRNIRVINSSSLLFVSYSQNSASTSSNGWWKINTDGSGLTRLNTSPNVAAGQGAWGPFNPYTQYLWSNFSRDGSLYTDGLFFGSLHGGSLTRYASDAEGDGDVLVGWTVI